MFCSNCGQRLADDAKHCPNCGMAVEEESIGAAAPKTGPVFQSNPANAPYSSVNEAPKAAQTTAPAPDYSATYGAPAAGTGLPAKEASSKEDKLALSGFICSIMGLVCCCVPLLGIAEGILGLIFSIKGLKGKNRHGMAVAGLVISIVGILINIIMLISTFLVVQESGGMDSFLEDFMESFGWEDYMN